MRFDEEDYFNHESLLIITEKGVLKRLKTPFKVLLIIGVDSLKAHEMYQVNAVITNAQNVMVYAIEGQCYFYYWFIVMG
jgi:hypothetical protein